MGDLLDQVRSGTLAHQRLEAHTTAREAVEVRRQLFGVAALPVDGLDYDGIVGRNCENVIGHVPVPVGIAGPVRVDGVDGHVPLATTEGALVASVCRGARAAGSITTKVLQRHMTRAPVLRCADLHEAAALHDYCDSHFEELRDAFAFTTQHGALTRVRVALAGRHAYVRCSAHTGDAMGMNMVGKGVDAIVRHLLARFPHAELLSLSGNYCVDKKASALNWIEGRGAHVVAEAVVPADVVNGVLKTSAKRLVEVHTYKNLVGSAMACCIGGCNAHAANVVAALFIACGQDPAHVVDSSACLTTVEDDDGAARISVTMPSVEVGTVGGGTHLAAQQACLDILGVAGAGDGERAARLAQIVAATVLAGELSLLAALCSNDLITSHMKLNRAKT